MARMNKEDMDEIKRHFDEKANEMVEAAETRVMTLCAANTAMALENKQRVIESTKQTRFAELANRHNSNARAKILIILNVNKVDKNEQGEVLDDLLISIMLSKKTRLVLLSPRLTSKRSREPNSSHSKIRDQMPKNPYTLKKTNSRSLLFMKASEISSTTPLGLVDTEPSSEICRKWTGTILITSTLRLTNSMLIQMALTGIPLLIILSRQRERAILEKLEKILLHIENNQDILENFPMSSPP